MTRPAARDSAQLACVIGEIDLVRALALGGIRSAVVAPPGTPARYSRAAKEIIEWADPWREPDLLVERLLAFARPHAEPPVLFYDGDWDVLLVSRHRDALRPAFRFVVPDAELVETLTDKARFQALAARLGLPVPAGHRISAQEARAGETTLRFPLVAKPLTRQHATWRPLTGAKAFHLADAAALRALGERLEGHDVDLLIQEAVSGPESRIESYHVYVDEAGAVAGEFTGRKVRTHPDAYGYSTALVITHEDDVAATGRGIAARIGLQGVAKMDFKRDADGHLCLLEINPRFNLWHHPGALAGVNLPALVFRDLTAPGGPRPHDWRPGVHWCAPAHDLQAARAAGMPLARWLAWAARCEAKSGFALDDPLPLVRAAGYRAGRYIAQRATAALGPGRSLARRATAALARRRG